MALERGPSNPENNNPEIKQAEIEKQEQQKIDHKENAEALASNTSIKDDPDQEVAATPEAESTNGDVQSIPEDPDDHQDVFAFDADSPYAKFDETAEIPEDPEAEVPPENVENPQESSEVGAIPEDPDGNHLSEPISEENDLSVEAEKGDIPEDPDGNNTANLQEDVTGDESTHIGTIPDDPDVPKTDDGNDGDPDVPKTDDGNDGDPDAPQSDDGNDGDPDVPKTGDGNDGDPDVPKTGDGNDGDPDVPKTDDGNDGDPDVPKTDDGNDGDPDAPQSDDGNDGDPDVPKTGDGNDGDPDVPKTGDGNDGDPDVPKTDDGNDGDPDAPQSDDGNDGDPDVPQSDDDNDGDPDVPQSDDGNDGDPDVPKTDDGNDGGPDVPQSDDGDDGDPDVPQSDDGNDGDPDVPQSDDGNDGDPDVPQSDDGNDGDPDVPKTDDGNDGDPDVPKTDDGNDGDPDAPQSDDGNDGDPDVPKTGDGNDGDPDVPKTGDGNDGDPDVPQSDDGNDGDPDVPQSDDGNDGDPDVPQSDDGNDGDPDVPQSDDGNDGDPDVPQSDDGNDGDPDVPQSDDGNDGDPDVPQSSDGNDGDPDVPQSSDGNDGDPDVPQSDNGNDGDSDASKYKMASNGDAPDTSGEAEGAMADGAEESRGDGRKKYEDLTPEDKALLNQTELGREMLNTLYSDMIERKAAEAKGMSVEEYRKYKAENDKEFSGILKAYNNANELNSTDAMRSALFTSDFETRGDGLMGNLKSELAYINAEKEKLENQPMKMEDYPRWKMLNNEKTKLEEQISSLGKILGEAKETERSNAFEQSKARLNAVRGDSKKARKEDLKKDQACVRNNIAAAYGLRRDLKATREEADKIQAKIADIINAHSLDDMRTDPQLSNTYKEFKELNHKYGELRDKEEKYDKQLDWLNELNQKLSEINGTDKKGNPRLEVSDLRKEVSDKEIADAIKAVNEASLSALQKEKLEPQDCLNALKAIDNAERVVIPALAEQVSGLDQKLSEIESYLKNNPPDAYFNNLKAELEKEHASKLLQLSNLVESTTQLKTHLNVGDMKHSAKCIINADGTYTLQQRWTNIKEKVTNHGSFKNTRQLFANAYDRVSNCKFDEKGNVLSKDFSFKYKLLGYFSERKIGGEKLNLHNIFETGLFNVRAKGGWDQEKGFNMEGGANVFEIKNSATLNVLNKQVMQLNANLSYMNAKGEVEFDKGNLTASFSMNDGVSGGADLSVGKVKLLDAAFSSWSNSISGNFGLAEAIGGKLEGIKVSGEDTNNSSLSFARMYEYQNNNGDVEHSAFISDFTGLFDKDTGFSDLKDAYDTFSDQNDFLDDIFENGIAEDEVSNEEKVAFQTKEHSDEQNKFNRASRDANDLGERTLNGAPSGEQPSWIKEADVLKSMDKSLLSLDDQKLVSEAVDKIQQGKPLSREDAKQLEYICLSLAGNGYAAEARAVSHLYSKPDISVKDQAGNVFAGARVDNRAGNSSAERIKTDETGKNFLNASPESGKTDWVSADEVKLAIKKSYLASDDMALVAESAEKMKRGETISKDDWDQLKYIADTLSENGYTREASAISALADAVKEHPQLLDNVAYFQGYNDFGAKGTCGPTSIANALNMVTGTQNFSENAVMHCAMENNLCHKGPNPKDMGGTTTSDIVDLVDQLKRPEHNIHTEVYENNKALSVDALADMLDKPGTVAIVGVDSATLWDKRGDVTSTDLFAQTEAPSDHWITVESAVRDGDGNVTGFTIVDSGGGVQYVDRDTFEAIYQGDANHKVSDPTAIIVTNQGEAVNKNSGSDGAERDAKFKGSAVISDGGDPPIKTSFESSLSEVDARGYAEFQDRTKGIFSTSEQREKAFEQLLAGDFVSFARNFNFSSPDNGAVFWSKNIDEADRYAKANGGTIMEGTEGGRVLNGWQWLNEKFPTWDDGKSTDQKPLWEAVSGTFATQVTGVVTYVHPFGQEGNVWKNIERPIILERMKNGYVTKLEEVFCNAK